MWFAPDHLKPGDNWQDEINRALRKASVLLLFVSPQALKSKYVKMEYRWFLNEGKAIVPVLIKNVKLPPELTGIQFCGVRDFDKIAASLQSYVNRKT